MNSGALYPHLSLAGDDDRQHRTARLFRAYDVMCALVRIVWPAEAILEAGPDGAGWEGAIVSMYEADGHLTVTWRDEDDYEKFEKVADLGWTAVGQEGTTVTHENADSGGATVLRYGFLY